MCCILGFSSLRPHSTSDQLLSSKHVDYLGTDCDDDGGDGGDASDMDTYKENYFAPTPTRLCIVT